MRRAKRTVIQTRVAKHLVAHPQPELIRTFHIKAYRSQLASFNLASEKMRRFREVDQVAFTTWWQLEFSSLLSQQLQLEHTLFELEVLHDAVEQYKHHHKCTYHRAYSLVSLAQSEGKLGEMMRQIFEEIDERQQKTFEKHRQSYAEQAFQAWIDEPASSARSEAEDFPAGEAIRSPTPEETSEHYIKKLYRDLVRVLHPDTKKGAEHTAEEKILWNELQNAYAWQDLERIESISQTLRGKASTALDFKTIPIGDIVAMKEAMSKKLNELRKDIKLAKKEANWDFENRRKNAKFMKQLSRSIEEELSEQSMQLEFRIGKLQKRILEWSSAHQNRKQKSSRRVVYDPDRHA